MKPGSEAEVGIAVVRLVADQDIAVTHGRLWGFVYPVGHENLNGLLRKRVIHDANPRSCRKGRIPAT